MESKKHILISSSISNRSRAMVQQVQIGCKRKIPLPTPSPEDDSDLDPDYTPEKENKVLNYFDLDNLIKENDVSIIDKLNKSYIQGAVYRKLGRWEYGTYRGCSFNPKLIDNLFKKTGQVPMKLPESQADTMKKSTKKQLFDLNFKSSSDSNNVNIKNTCQDFSLMEGEVSPIEEYNNVKSTSESTLVQENNNDEEANAEQSKNAGDVEEINESITLEGNGKNKSKKSFEKNLLSPCKTTCRRKCSERISETQRAIIFDYFNKLDFGEKRLFIGRYLQKENVKVYRKEAETHKGCSVKYYLPFLLKNTNNGPEVVPEEGKEMANQKGSKLENKSNQVCKTMFLHTLGCKTDSIITGYLKNIDKHFQELSDKRGEKRGKMMKEISAENYSLIKAHIDCFHPIVSHYNLSHAPLRRYLPSDLSIYQLWA